MGSFIGTSLKKNEKIIVGIAIFYILITSILAITLHHNFHIAADPIGLHMQELESSMEGNFFYRPIEGRNLFEIHNSPIHIFYLPAYFLFPSYFILILIQNIAIAIAGIFIYKIALMYLKEKEALIMYISFMLFPALIVTNIKNASPMITAILPVTLMIYFLLKKNNLMLVIMSVVTLLFKENTPLMVIPIGIYTFFKLNKQTGLKIIVISALWLVISFSIVFPMGEGQNEDMMGDLYGYLGDSSADKIKNIIFQPIKSLDYQDSLPLKITYAKEILIHTSFISLLSPGTLLMAAPIVAQNVYSTSSYKYDFRSHYNYILIPIIFLSSIIGLTRLNSRTRRIILILILILSIISFAKTGAGEFVKENCYLFKDSKDCTPTGDILGNANEDNFPNIREAIKIIEPGSIVATQINMFVQIEKDNHGYMFDYGEYNQTCIRDYLFLFEQTYLFALQQLILVQ